MGQVNGLCQNISPSFKILVNSQNGACSPERYLGRTCLKGTFLKEEADAKTTRVSRVSKLTKRENRER